MIDSNLYSPFLQQWAVTSKPFDWRHFIALTNFDPPPTLPPLVTLFQQVSPYAAVPKKKVRNRLLLSFARSWHLACCRNIVCLLLLLAFISRLISQFPQFTLSFRFALVSHLHLSSCLLSSFAYYLYLAPFHLSLTSVPPSLLSLSLSLYRTLSNLGQCHILPHRHIFDLRS